MGIFPILSLFFPRTIMRSRYPARTWGSERGDMNKSIF